MSPWVRLVAVALSAIGIIGLPPTAAGGSEKAPAFEAPRILYTSDWSGTRQIYALDPSGRSQLGQMTFDRAPACGEASCGYSDPVPSPDGTKVAFWDSGGCAGNRKSFYVARADGTLRHRIARSRYTCSYSPSAVWASASDRLALVVDGFVSVVRPDGWKVRDLGRGSDPAWSSQGLLGFVSHGRFDHVPVDQLVVVGPHAPRRVIDTANDFSWSPDGRWIAYSWSPPSGGPGGGTYIVHPNGTGRRRLSADASTATWSADGRFLGFDARDGVHLLEMSTRRTRVLAAYSGPLLWTPAGHTVATEGRDRGEYTIDAVSGVGRLLTPDSVGSDAAWSPDGRSLAYVSVSYAVWDSTGELKIASVGQGVRELVSSTADHSGDIRWIAWTRPPATTRYRPAAARSLATVSADELLAPWPITRLAADGGRVAYASCGHVFAWAPSTEGVAQAELQTSLSPRCTTPDNYVAFEIYSLAVAGGRVAYGARQGNMGQVWWLNSTTLTPPTGSVTLNVAFGASGCSGGGPGELAGSDDLLVFSDWREQSGCPPRTTQQTIERADPGACAWTSDQLSRRPCSVVATSPGPLVPFDVNEGRIVAGGENATVVLDGNGRQLLSIPVSPLAAQLSGPRVIVLTRGRLRDYDAATGEALHSWALPDVASGGECGSAHHASWECHDPRLVLEDAARGLVTYILDGQVHLLRLADGADTVVAAGTLARFMDAGLVYAAGSRLHLVPFDQLPLQ